MHSLSRRQGPADVRRLRRELSSVVTLGQTWCVCLPLVVFWSFVYVALMLLTTQPPHPTVSPQQVALDELVDRDTVCDRLQRGILDPAQLNSSVLDACRRWTVAQADYFRPRSQRINTFRRRLLKNGDRVCSDRTFVVVVVHSLHTHVDRRAAIRETWGGAAVSGVWPHSLSRVCKTVFSLSICCVLMLASTGLSKLNDHRRHSSVDYTIPSETFRFLGSHNYTFILYFYTQSLVFIVSCLSLLCKRTSVIY